MSNAQEIIERFGGHEQVAAITGRSLVSVYRWTYPIEKGGTGGQIPKKCWDDLMAEARKREISLRLADLAGIEDAPAE